MRKILSLLVAVMAISVGLKAQTVVIDDGFENGLQDSVWSQEYVVGQHPWVVEDVSDGLVYPNSVVQGTKRLCLRNNTGETQGYVTRLVSKVMDLSEVYQPFLSFYYANPKWTADRDTIRVYYKNSAKSDWVLLQEISDAASSWQKVSISLPRYNSTYQVAIEGKDNLGRGIVLDSVKLRSAPECTVPHDLYVIPRGNGKATLGWQASWDAENFELVVAKEPIDIDTLVNVSDSLIALKTIVPGSSHTTDVELTSGEYFYAYVRSICEAETSDWCPVFTFRMKATVYLPYSYDFNMDYDAGKIHRNVEWTWGNNTGNYNPFIATHLNSTELAKYSKDATSHLVFSGANSSTTAIPAGKYAYAATPGLADTTVAKFNLKDYQVRFTSTVHAYTGAYAHSIIVGVMTDPEDITTFVAVDTVSVWGYATFQDNIVSLASYDGEGQYVAFLSQFDKPNLFYIDDLTIERIPAVNPVTEISVNPRDTFATISWNATGAAKYTVLIADVDKDPATMLEANIIDKAEVTGTEYVCKKLEADHNLDKPYYVYIQADTLAWSYRKPFTTIKRQISPINLNMEQTSGYFILNNVATTAYPQGIGIYSNDADLPCLYGTNPHGGTGSCLYMMKDAGNDAWVTFPIADLPIQDLQITFYLSGNTTPAQAHATVGVMTNPMDLSTFEPVADYQLAEQGYYRCYNDFKNYKGTGDVIAIRWTDIEGKTVKPTCYIDDVVIEELGNCLPPSGVQVNPTDTSVVLTWNASDKTQWELAVTKSKLAEAEQNDEIWKNSKVFIYDTLILEDPTKDPKFEIAGLEWGTSYYIYVRTLCGGEDKAWWSEFATKTVCPDNFALPYTDDFERLAAGTDLGCWQGFDQGGIGYPKIMTTAAHLGNNSVELWSTGTTHRTWMVAPQVDAPLDQLLVDFYARSYGTTTKSVIYVGTTNTPEDIASIQLLDTFYMEGTTAFNHFAIDLSSFSNLGQYLIFTSGIADTLELNSDIYLDDVRFQKAMCAAAYNVRQEDATQTSVKVAWDGKCSEKWEYIFADTLVAISDSLADVIPAKNVLKHDSVEAAIKEFAVGDLKTYTKYYVYVRPTCGLREWTVDSVMTECFKIKPGAPKETFEQYTAGTSYAAADKPACWLGGNLGTGSSYTSYLPYIYSSTSYAHSGTNVLRLYSSYSATASSNYSPAWVATPEIDTEDMSKVVVNFYQYTSSSYYCYWGVMTDPTDYSTFVTLDSIKGETKPVLVSVDLADYKDKLGNAKYFAWRTQDGKSSYSYLDDISILSGNCPMAKPSISDLTATSARIASGIRTSDDWWLLLANKEIPTDTLEIRRPVYGDTIYVIAEKDTAKIAFYEKISAKSKTLTDLLPQTTYYAYVQCDCDTVFGAWAGKSFTTPCTATSPEDLGTLYFKAEDGYATGTTGAMPCWTKGSKTTTSATYIPYVNNLAAYKYNGNNYLYFYSYFYSTTSAYDGGYAIMPFLDVDDISKYQVSFMGRGYNATTDAQRAYGKSVIVGVVTDPTDLNTFVALDTVEGSNTGYEPFTVSFEQYEGDYMGNKGKYVMFLSEFGKTNYFYMTGITVSTIPSCRPSYDAVVDSVAEDAAMFSWKGYSDSYRLKLAKEFIEDANKPAYTDWLVDTLCTSSDSILIQGLDGGTNYYAYIQSVCEDTAVFAMGAVQFRTECPETYGYKIPYYEDFDKSTQTGTGKRPDCWMGFCWNMLTDTLYSTQSYPYVYTTTSASYDKKGYCMYMYSSKTASIHYTSYAIAPKVKGDLNELMVSFQMRKSSATQTSYGKTLRVGYVTDWSSEKAIKESFVKLDDVDAEESTVNYVFCSVNMSELNAKIPAGARIALYADPTISSNVTAASSYGGFYIDNFKIGLPPSCFAPKVEATGKSTLTTADVNITPAKPENKQWQLSVMTKEVYERNSSNIDKVIDNPDSTMLIVVNDTNVTLTGLESGSMYEVYARTLCSAEDTSEWTDAPAEVRTKYYYKDSYFFGFEKSEGWMLSKYSTSDANYIHPAIETGYEGGTASTSSSYYPYAIENTTLVYCYGNKNQADNIAGLRFGGSATYWGGYAIFPAVDSAQTRSFEFKVRNGYLTASTMKVSTSYDGELEVGLVDKNQGFTNYEVLGTISMTKLANTTAASATNDWFFKSVTLDLDSATVADKQVVLRMPKQPSTSYIYVDNVTMGEAKGYGLVSLSKIEKTASTANITWSQFGGPWNLKVYNTDKDGKKSTEKASYTNLTATAQLVEGLDPQTTYIVELTAANAPAGTNYVVSSEKTFTTPCLPLEADVDGAFFWDFNDPSTWEKSNQVTGTAVTDSAYYKPECFTMGSTYQPLTTTSTPYNWLVQRKAYTYTGAPTTKGTTATSTLHYEYGRHDSPAMRIYTTSTYMTPYMVLPELNCGFDTMMVEFWGRCFANYDATYGTASSQNKMQNATYLGASYSKSIVVGTLTDPEDFSTLEVIDTVTYDAYTSTTADFVTKDPTGERYWQKFQLPLGNPKGKYIVFFQPAYGLFFMDDLSVKPIGANVFTPSNAEVEEFGSDTVKLTWTVKHPTFKSVVTLSDMDNTIVRQDTVSGNSHIIRGLEPGAQYQWTVYQFNGENKSSEAIGESFVLQCLAISPNGFATGFESTEEPWTLIPGQTALNYKQNKCWVYGNAGTSAWSTSSAYNYPASSTISYAHSGAYGIKLYAYSTTMLNYVAAPAVEDVAAYDTLQVEFWMRPAHHNPGTGKISTQYTTGSTASTAEYYYARTVVVGTMTDPNDPTTFVPIDTLTYSRTLTTSDDANAANNFLFEKATVSLQGATGPYVAFMASLYAKGDSRKSTYDYMCLDDIAFTKLQECKAPTDLKVSDIEQDGATLSWTGCEISEKYYLEISTDPNFDDPQLTIYADTVDTNAVKIDGLDKFTQYVWRVSSLCTGDAESDFSVNATFKTLRSPFYLEDFRDVALDGDWSFGTTPISKVMDDSLHAEITGANSTTYGFHRITTSVGLPGAHYYVPFYSSSATTTYTYDYYWMVSPVLALDTVQKAIFTMDMALTKATSGYSAADAPALPEYIADDFVFVVAISEDAGKTWNKENIKAAIIGQNLLALNTPQTMRLDLSQYKGKKISIGLYREAQTYMSTGAALHFSNIRVNYFDSVAIDTTSCQYNDIEAFGFKIDGDNIEPGIHTYNRLQIAGESDAYAGYKDTLYNLTAEYYPVPETLVSDTICEGERYSGYDFHEKTITGVYRRKLSAENACDSLVTLSLYVTPRRYAQTEEELFCKGDTFSWQGRDFTRQGIYYDTLVSSVGCDSVVSLNLQYYADEETIIETTTIQVDELPFTYNKYVYLPGQKTISYPVGTEPGTYVDTVGVVGVNCATTLIHTLVIVPGTGLDTILDEQGADGKMIYNEHLYIRRDNQLFDATGRKTRIRK